MEREKLTLNNIKSKIGDKPAERHYRASDFVSDEDRAALKAKNFKQPAKTAFTAVDAYIAEIIGRFGYEAYRAWRAGEITETNMSRYIEAERARDARQRLSIEAVIISALAGAQQPRKKGSKPPLKAAIDIFKSEQKAARGVK